MISEGLCDTENWNNDTENSAFLSNKHQINAVWVSTKNFFQKHKILLTTSVGESYF